jgi:hypothetical protein
LSKHAKLLQKVVRGDADANIRFKDLCQLLLKLGFEEHTRGSHHIFTRLNVEELINLQEDGAKAKVYQVRQVRALILSYELELP